MLPTQIGDITDTDSVSGGEGCQTTSAVMLEQMVYFTYWLESFMAWVL